VKEPKAEGDSCRDAICFEPEAGVAYRWSNSTRYTLLPWRVPVGR